MTDRQAFLDLYEVYYENARDDGWPADRAEKWAEAQAMYELSRAGFYETHCEFCDGPLSDDRYCPSCQETSGSVAGAPMSCLSGELHVTAGDDHSASSRSSEGVGNKLPVGREYPEAAE